MSLSTLFRRHRRQPLFDMLLHLLFTPRFTTLIDADCAAGNPVETKTILAREVRLGPSVLTVGNDGSQANEKRERHRSDCYASDERFGKPKLSAQQPVNCSADQ